MSDHSVSAMTAIASGQLTVSQVWAFAKWRKWRSLHGFTGVASRSELEAFIGDNRCVGDLAYAIEILLPGSVESNRLRAIGERNRRKYQVSVPTKQTALVLKLSVAKADLPQEWLFALVAMEAGNFGANGESAPQPRRRVKITHTLRQLCHAARNAGIDHLFGVDALKVYVESLRRRGLRSISVSSRLGEITKFFKYIGVDSGTIDLLRAESRFHEKKVRLSAKRKDVFLRATGINLATFAGIAIKLLDEIDSTDGTRMPVNVRFAKFRDIALFALCLACAPRRADITKLIVGVNMKRDRDQWEIDYVASKNEAAIGCFIDRRLTIFLDQAILLGASPCHIEELYLSRVGTPFFVRNASNEPLSRDWPYRRVQQHIGCGPHIARTLWFEAGARFSKVGIEAAIALCGHRSRKTAEEYLTSYSREEAALTAIELLADIASECS